MNIKEAKEQIKNAMTAYFSKDDCGNYVIPIEKQRPVFVMGPPGIGKTAVMEQIASELGVGLLSYSMTHHTRQSALGLPFITHKTYGGKEYSVSEYTMSEIIASVYELIENTGMKEGILFLDEINCVSETLTPVMLQFLQYKVFGRHRIPEGWIVVTAGNPPEYNSSVREFDIATWDRLKRIDVEPDFDVWKEFAYRSRVHQSVITYLEIKKADFYRIESTVNGKEFVTARGWDDLSQMIILYEKNNIKVDVSLVSQYVQSEKTAKSFANYYDLFNKYKSDYQINDILNGKADGTVSSRAKNARFDERLALIGLMLEAVFGAVSEVIDSEDMLSDVIDSIKNFKKDLSKKGVLPADAVQQEADRINEELINGRSAGNLSHAEFLKKTKIISLLHNYTALVTGETDAKKAMQTIKADFDVFFGNVKKSAEDVKKKLSNVFRFCENIFDEGNEILILVTELTSNYYSSEFISRHGCDEYFAHNRELLFYERQKEIISKIDELDIDEVF